MYLGIDLGTSAVKATLIDDAQTIVGSEQAALEVSRPHPGWSEQNPRDWIAAAERAVDALRAVHGGALAAVRGVGLSGQMHGATLLDEHDATAAPLPALERHARADGSGSARLRPTVPRDHGQHRVSWFHRAEGGMGEAARAACVRAHALGPAAQGRVCGCG